MRIALFLQRKLALLYTAEIANVVVCYLLILINNTISQDYTSHKLTIVLIKWHLRTISSRHETEHKRARLSFDERGPAFCSATILFTSDKHTTKVVIFDIKLQFANPDANVRGSGFVL